MHAVEFFLKYNSTILEVLDVVDGSFMEGFAAPPDPETPTYLFIVRQEPGWIDVFIWVNVGWGPYPAGSGTLSTITFKAIAESKGEYVLQFEETGLWEEGMEDPTIPCDVRNGYYRTHIFGDLNFDSIVDIRDLGIAAKAFGSSPGHPRWNPIADVDKNNVVNIMDLAFIAKNFGKTY